MKSCSGSIAPPHHHHTTTTILITTPPPHHYYPHMGWPVFCVTGKTFFGHKKIGQQNASLFDFVLCFCLC